MPNARKLALKRETLTVLTNGELSTVAGGSHACNVTDRCTHGPSIDESCPTAPVVVCVTGIDISRMICY